MSKPYYFFITGANGYIGHKIVAELDKNKLEWSSVTNQTGQKWRFGESAFFNIDSKYTSVLIHCAWNMKADSSIENQLMYKSSCELFDRAAQLGMKIIFISSMSAFENCSSLYGQTKLGIEKYLNAMNSSHYIVRPGLVWEDGQSLSGIIGVLQKIVSLLPVVPYLHHGSGQFYFTEVGDLVRVLVLLSKDELKWNNNNPVLANPKGYTLKAILLTLAGAQKRRVWLVPIPAVVLKIAVKILCLCGVRIIRYDSLVSLLNLDMRPFFADVSQGLKSFS